MAQSDLTIQNQSFPSFRSDLNDALTALNTTQSGTSRPSSAVAGTIWLDTTNATSPTLKLYDGGDDISLATLDYSANTVNWLDSTVSADLVNDLSPQLGGMLDVNGNAIGNGTEELIKFSETASAVNELTVTNSATGNAPEISATGDDTNIDFKLTPKGTGKLVLDGLNFPTADGTTGQFLKTDGSGNLSFAEAGGGITIVDQWRLTTSITSIGTTQVVLSSNWGQMSGDGYGGIGSSMTQSSGVFTFPETGIYLIQGQFNFEQSTNDNNEVRLFIETTLDNSSYSAITRGNANMHSGWYSSTMPHAIFDVTDVTTHKVRFAVRAGNPDMSVLGTTALFYSGATFIKLGDT